MISAAAIKRLAFEFITKYESVWASTIAFSMIGIVLSLTIYILNILKIPKNNDFEFVMDIIVSFF
jgi:hypothetical protein